MTATKAEDPTTDAPIVSDHAADRWDQRTDPYSVAPETAWDHAQRIDPGGPLRNVDEVRYHHSTETLLLRDASQITTVYSLDELTRPVYHGVEHAIGDHHE